MTNGYMCSDIFLAHFQPGMTESQMIDLGAHYDEFLIWCENCAGIRPNTMLRFIVGCSDSTRPCDMYTVNDPSTIWERKLPTVGSFAFLLQEIKCISSVTLKLSNAVARPVCMHVRGIEPAHTFA